VVRVKLPSGVELMPHRHREDRLCTVMSGVFYIGVGKQFDAGKLQAYPVRSSSCPAASRPAFTATTGARHAEEGHEQRGPRRPAAFRSAHDVPLAVSASR
jgi:hypothetical protein